MVNKFLKELAEETFDFLLTYNVSSGDDTKVRTVIAALAETNKWKKIPNIDTAFSGSVNLIVIGCSIEQKRIEAKTKITKILKDIITENDKDAVVYVALMV